MSNPEDSDSILEPIDNSTASAEDLYSFRRSQHKTDESVTYNVGIDGITAGHVHIGDYIAKAIYISPTEIKTHKLNQVSPYKGLKKFEPEDKDRFFGRDQFIKDLANELKQTNLILLLGASGSGKSSVVRAGLLSWLSKNWDSGLVSLTFTPDQDPFESLYASLLRYYKQAEAQVAREGREDTLTQIVKTLRQRDAYWFIFIDQFEELFTTSQADKRDRFITGLAKLNTALKLLGSAQACPVKVMATMRADFLDRLSPYPALVEATNKHRPMIAEMQLDELRKAIEQPAAQHGVVFETGLVEEIIKDVQGQAGYLPLLQYTLNLVWDTEVQNGSIHDRTLNISTYRELGGVRGALQKHVSQIYEALPEAERLAAQRVFLKLVEIGGDEESGTQWKPVRRRAAQSEFDSEPERRVLARLIDENLLVSDQQPQAQESTVEIAHEALLTSWEMLNTWIKENRQAIALRNRLNDDVARWQAKKSEDELWTGSKLEQVLELKKNPTFNQVMGGFSATANQFIDTSLGLRDRFRKRELRRRTVVVASIATSILGMVGFGWWNTEQSWQSSLDVWSRAETPHSSSELDFLKDAEVQAEKDKKAGKVERALAIYRQLRAATVESLAKDVTKQGDLQTILTTDTEHSESLQKLLHNSPEIRVLLEKSKNAEKALAEILRETRLKMLEMDLRDKKFGRTVENPKFSDFEKQYTESALQKTYAILLMDFGAGADLNKNGVIDTEQEAAQMPCQTLLEIEKLWLKEKCSWDNSQSSSASNECNALQKSSLTDLIFSDFQYAYIATNRIKACKNMELDDIQRK